MSSPIEDVERWTKELARVQKELQRANSVLEQIILNDIASGSYTPDYLNPYWQNSINRLRRNGKIVNKGTRKHPDWAIK